MIFRAFLGLALFYFLIPHEPDIGFGRPGLALDSVTACWSKGISDSMHSKKR